MMASASLFDRWIARPRWRWPGWAICTVLLCMPVVLAVAEVGLAAAVRQPGFRGLLIAPLVITYIFLVSPLLTCTADQVILGLRPLLDLDEPSFLALVEANSRVGPGRERRVIAGGALLGALQVLVSIGGWPDSWQEAYWLLTTVALYSLLGWVIYESFVGTRLIAAMHRKINRVDPLDSHPFDAVGRQSLLVSLVFIGGISLSLLLIADQPEMLRRPEFWLVYLPLAMIPVAIFFLNMRPTHRLLRRAKRDELQQVTRQVNASSRHLGGLLEQGQPTGNLAAEIGALMAYERRLESARTWPYNTTMLRTLALSVFVPLATIVARNVAERIFG